VVLFEMTISFCPMTPKNHNAAFYSKGYRRVPMTNIAAVAERIFPIFCWSPIIWNNGERAEKNFITSEWCGLDFDTPETSLDWAKKNFCDAIHIIGTTKSHQKEKSGIICDRFRVVLKFEVPIRNLKQYKYNMALYAERYNADRQCVDGARFYWPCNKIVSISQEGYTQDVYEAKEEVKEPFDLEAYKTKPISEKTLHLHRYGAVHGQRNERCFKSALELFRKGFSHEEAYNYVFFSIPTGSDFTHDEKMSIIRSAFKYKDTIK
jgi:hypothetical protein